MIEKSNLVIVVLTQNGSNSSFVQQEIGYAKSRKPMLILAERGCENRISGFIYGCDFISIDPWNPQSALSRIHQVLSGFKQQEDKQEAIAKLILLGFGLFFLSSKKQRRN
jgi:hypothetical protein